MHVYVTIIVMEELRKKDDLVIVEGSDELHDQWWSHDAIFHL